MLLLIKFCRFDIADTRNNQRDDRFGHIREAWELFNNRCRELYRIGPHVTIDEMLQKFCGRCRFRQYMPQKPGWYGIKYWIFADAESYYCSNAISYQGKESNTPAVNLGVTDVTKLVEHNATPTKTLPVIVFSLVLTRLKISIKIISQQWALLRPIGRIFL